MRRGVLVLLLIGVAVLAAVANAGSRPISAKPASGRAKTRFAVSFRAPDRAGRVGTIWRQYDVDANGPASRHGCVSQVSVPVRLAATHARVRVTLVPTDSGMSPAGSGRWCRGTFHGVIDETQTPVCSAGRLCPLFVVVKRIGKFTFRVR